jgi:hypothetical protein
MLCQSQGTGNGVPAVHPHSILLLVARQSALEEEVRGSKQRLGNAAAKVTNARTEIVDSHHAPRRPSPTRAARSPNPESTAIL